MIGLFQHQSSPAQIAALALMALALGAGADLGDHLLAHET